MRILHTSDWHLGKHLMGFSRIAEQEAFCDELVELAQSCDLVIVSGDVFDTYNPPIEAEELLYETLARLGDGGQRAVVVIAGNHDSPDRLAAPGPLSITHGVFLYGRPGDDVARSGTTRGRVGIAESGPSYLKLDLPCGERACVVAVPYPSEARLRALLSGSLDERDLQEAYEGRLRQAFDRLAERCFQGDAVNLLTTHLTVSSCMPSESERILVGGAYQVDASVFPESAQYVALGHLHRAQDVDAAPIHTRYAGSPLAFRVSEREYRRTHTVVTVEPGGVPTVEEIPIRAGRPLIEWEATGGLQEVLDRCEAGDHLDAYIDLQLHVPAPLTHTEMATIQALPRDFLRIRTILPQVEPRQAPQVEDEPTHAPVELFRTFVKDQTDREADPELIALFEELAQAAMGGSA